MNLIEQRAAGYNKYSLKDIIKANIRSANAQHSYTPKVKKTRPIYVDGATVNIDEAIRIVLKKHGGKKTWAAYHDAYKVSHFLCIKAFPKLYETLTERNRKYVSEWQPCIWANNDWVNTKLQELHACHISTEDPTQVAFTPDVPKLLADRQTRMKPGRYLMKFYGPESDNPVLSEADCKHWADKHFAATAPAELRVVPNTDPDGWEWVYENSPPSCMRYNRSNRYLNQGLYGINHPVRAYAHPENDLALAYIMMPGEKEDRDKNCARDEFVVGARTIINVESKKWQRIYANDNREAVKLKTLLETEGYAEGNALYNQTLARREYEDGIICPYLDGGYTCVEDEGDCLAVSCDGMDGQNSGGVVVNTNHYTCDRCDDRCDEDDLTWIESEEQSVCSNCLEWHYIYAWVNRRDQEYVNKDDAYEVNGDYYTADAMEYHDIYFCQHCDEYRHMDDMITLENGDTVCQEHADQCEVSEEWHLTYDMVETEFDGTIYEEYAVKTFPDNEWGWVEKCYKLDLPEKTIYVHQDVMDSKRFSELFGQWMSMLEPINLLTVPVRADFVPTNVTEGDECVSITDIIESRGVEVDDEDEDELVPFAGLLPPSSNNVEQCTSNI